MSRWLVVTLGALLLFGAGPRPRPRSRAGVRENRRAAALLSPSVWKPEPASPTPVDPARFARALRSLCGFMPPGRAESYAAWTLSAAAQHGEDPFLLAALAFRMSRCLPDASTVEGVGLTALPLDMYRENVRGRRLEYTVGGELQRVELPRPYLAETLVSAETNLAWAAALLAMWRAQHAEVDRAFPQAPHRHPVSHFVWGDKVRSARAEDRIFTDRRRLLAYYGVSPPEVTKYYRGVTWGAPLEGAPRVVSSRPGADRDGGLRSHRGIDVEAVHGEPVRAMADGRVAFAGVDFPGLANSVDMPPSRIREVPRESLGRGGRYVCITHLDAQGDEAWLRSCYMHLEDVLVRSGERVTRGQTLGTVGRTGMQVSSPHLHLELKSDKRLYDARDVLGELLLGDPPPDVARKKRRVRRAPTASVDTARAAP